MFDSNELQVVDQEPQIVFASQVDLMDVASSKRINSVQPRAKLSTIRKLCFGIGGLPFQLCSNVIGLYAVPFLLEVANIQPFQISFILLTVRIVDAFFDPLIGFLISKTRTRFGRLRVWMVLSSPLFIVAYVMIWYVPDISKNAKPYWYLGFYCLFTISLACLHVPYTALTMHVANDQNERDSATYFRITFEMIGIVLAGVIQGIVISVYGQAFDCNSLNATMMSSTNNTLNKLESTSNGLKTGYLVSTFIQLFIYVCCTLITVISTKEINDENEDTGGNFFTIAKSILTHKPFAMLLLAFLFSSLSCAVAEGNLALYFKYAVNAKSIYQILIMIILLTGITVLPLWHLLMVKFGKKAIYISGNMLFVGNLIMAAFLKDNVPSIYLVSIFCGITIATMLYVPWSMLPDTIDDYYLKTGSRRESYFYSLYVCFSKATVGIALAASAGFLELGGYTECEHDCCTQPDSVGITLKLILVPAPIVFSIISSVFVWKYPLNEKRMQEIQLALEQKTTDTD